MRSTYTPPLAPGATCVPFGSSKRPKSSVKIGAGLGRRIRLVSAHGAHPGAPIKMIDVLFMHGNAILSACAHKKGLALMISTVLTAGGRPAFPLGVGWGG